MKLSEENLKELIEESDQDYLTTSSIFNKIKDKKLLVACSGGADSVALALFAKAFDLDFALTYIEHGINSVTADCEILVKSLAEELNVPFFCAYLDLAENELIGSNVEAVARSFRYEALEKLRVLHGYDLVATAHHQDDIAETFLINLIRGAGSGISSLSNERENLIRPLLHWRKSDLEKLVNQTGLEYFEDPMNLNPRFVRNRIRNEVIPLLDDIASRDVVPLIARTARFSKSDNDYLTKTASTIWPGQEASTRSLMNLDPVLRVHALRAWITGYPPSEQEMERILEVVEHKKKSVQISGHRTIWRTGAVLYQDITPQHK